jgi:beta-barrel assembly-enhancing protease
MEHILYFDGLSSRAWTCKIDVRDEEILIQIDDTLKIISWKIKDIISKELTGSMLTLKYGKFPHETIEIKGEKALDFYELIAKHTLRGKSNLFWYRKKTLVIITLIFSFVLLCFLSYWNLIPWLGEKATLLVPRDTEIQLGASIAENFKQTEEVNEESSKLVNQLLDSLHVNEAYPIQITVINSETVNAFALPGGQIFVYSGIIDKMKNYNELVALLSHEITHVTHQHSLKSLGRSAATSIFISGLFGDISGISAGIIDQANQLKQLRYSRELETEADQHGVDFMVKYKVSPEGMVELMKILDAEGEKQDGFMKYLSTHPETKERIRTLNSNERVELEFKEKQELKTIFNEIKRSIK